MHIRNDLSNLWDLIVNNYSIHKDQVGLIRSNPRLVLLFSHRIVFMTQNRLKLFENYLILLIL